MGQRGRTVVRTGTGNVDIKLIVSRSVFIVFGELTLNIRTFVTLTI